jgi:hypothetical protein
MLQLEMPTPRTRKPPAAKPMGESRRKSKLTIAADDAARRLLLDTLVRRNWALKMAASDLDLNGSAAVIKAIRQLNLVDAYEAARLRGDIRPGVRPKKTHR